MTFRIKVPEPGEWSTNPAAGEFLIYPEDFLAYVKRAQRLWVSQTPDLPINCRCTLVPIANPDEPPIDSTGDEPDPT